MYHPNYTARPSTAPSQTFRNEKQSAEVATTQEKVEIAQNDHSAVSKLLNHKIDENQYLIDKLGEENREISNLLRASQSYSSKIVKSEGEQKVIKMPTDTVLLAVVKDSALQVDKLKADRLRYGEKLKNLRDSIALMENEIDRPEPVVEKALKTVRELENDLDDASIKEKEAFSIQDTYKTIISKLRQESLRFEKELEFADCENTTFKRDIEQLSVYAMEAREAAQLTQAERDNYKENIEQTQIARREELLNRRHEAETILEHEREAERQRQEETENLVAESLKMETKETAVVKAGLGDQFLRHELEKVRDFAGVDDLEELVRKCEAESQNRDEMEAICRENEDKLAEINKEVEDLRIQLEDTAFISDSMGYRRVLDKLKEEIQEEHFRVSTIELHSQKADAQFNLVNRAAQHLCELLYIIEGGDENITLADSYSVESMEKLLRLVSVKFGVLKDNLVEPKMILSSQMKVSRATNCVDIEDDDDAVDMEGDWDGSTSLFRSSEMQQVTAEEKDFDDFDVTKDDTDFERMRKQLKDASRRVLASQKKEEW